MPNTDRQQLEELREYWGNGNEAGLLRSIFNAAVDLAVAFEEYEKHQRNGIPGADPDLHRMVNDVLLASMRASCQHVHRYSPIVGQTLDDIKELLAE
jgi:hypothetical protein